jgi:hypothetical protein
MNADERGDSLKQHHRLVHRLVGEVGRTNPADTGSRVAIHRRLSALIRVHPRFHI